MYQNFRHQYSYPNYIHYELNSNPNNFYNYNSKQFCFYNQFHLISITPQQQPIQTYLEQAQFQPNEQILLQERSNNFENDQKNNEASIQSNELSSNSNTDIIDQMLNEDLTSQIISAERIKNNSTLRQVFRQDSFESVLQSVLELKNAIYRPTGKHTKESLNNCSDSEKNKISDTIIILQNDDDKSSSQSSTSNL
ncbi:unnamed protein product [Brachionus calyciflorus]|uniref:Uncharacterized protein n=1 Tax=Brachionus calyciflorus TaxID=104777 RepID=A0A814I3I1_9BILA|nr:unnamed protein product [Brachionus calyciflorus]